MAEFLGQNEIRFQTLQKFLVNLVNVPSAQFNFTVNVKAPMDPLMDR
jgi:hypothetical protein